MDMLIKFLAAAIVSGTPLLFGTLGEILTEKAGHLNLGVEGMMAMGAIAGFYVGYKTSNVLLSLLTAFAAGVLCALIYAFLTITLKATHNVTGLALTIFGSGLSSFIAFAMIKGAENGVPVLTAKAPGPGRARSEWELPGGTLRDLHRLAEQGAPLDLTRLTPEQLRSQCGVRFRRLRCLAELPGATAELALDEGVFTGGGRETPFWELEAELKGGSEDALAQWCRSLADAWGLLEEPRSKFLRAMALTEK